VPRICFLSYQTVQPPLIEHPKLFPGSGCDGWQVGDPHLIINVDLIVVGVYIILAHSCPKKGLTNYVDFVYFLGLPDVGDAKMPPASTYIYIYIYTHTRTVHTHTYIYIYIQTCYICVCVYFVCVCVSAPFVNPASILSQSLVPLYAWKYVGHPSVVIPTSRRPRQQRCKLNAHPHAEMNARAYIYIYIYMYACMYV